MIVTERTPVKPKINNIDICSDDKLFEIINNDYTTNPNIQCLAELLHRALKQNMKLVEIVTKLEREISNLKTTLNPPKKKCGRKAEEFFVNGKNLDDEYLVYLIDSELYTIRELEKEVGANKNQLRRRIERYKEREERQG